MRIGAATAGSTRGARSADRSRRFVSSLLTLAMLAPLVGALLAAGIAAASDDCCPDCPPPSATADAAPCHGSLLLSCCDDVATTAKTDGRRFDSRDAATRCAPVLVDTHVPTNSAALVVPAELAWLTSPLRLSVVIRT